MDKRNKINKSEIKHTAGQPKFDEKFKSNLVHSQASGFGGREIVVYVIHNIENTYY